MKFSSSSSQPLQVIGGSDTNSNNSNEEIFDTKAIADGVLAALKEYSLSQSAFSDLVLKKKKEVFYRLIKNPRPYSTLRSTDQKQAYAR